EDVARAMANVFHRLHGPVLASADLVAVDASGTPAPELVTDMHPRRLPDLYQQDQLVVLGRYREPESGCGTLRFHLGGEWLGQRRRFELSFDLSAASARNTFVPRLWASRRIAFLIDQVRQAGAYDPGRALGEPRFAELRDEILRLSTAF